MRLGAYSRMRAAALGLLVLLLAPPPAGAGELRPTREWVEARLRALLGMRTASWVQRIWEKKASEEQTIKARCYWAEPNRLRLDIEEGYGKGARLYVQGEDLTIRPPGILSALTLHRRVTDPRFRSLRGHDLRQAAIFDQLEFILSRWEQVTVTATADGAVLNYQNRDNHPVRAALTLEPLRRLYIEVSEGDQVVERNTYEQIELNAPIDPGTFVP